VSLPEVGPVSAEGGNDAERAVPPPLPMSEPTETACLKYAHVFLRPLRPKHI
jgi:hypothetical protein